MIDVDVDMIVLEVILCYKVVVDNVDIEVCIDVFSNLWVLGD